MSVVGVFDSGVGGLSVLREIRRELPRERLLYVADSANAPYGDKSADFVVSRSDAIARFLISQGATSLVVACNTATAVAIDTLRATYAFPIVGVEPAVKPAVQQTRAGVVGVLTTSRTALSARFRRLLARHGGERRILVQPCPGWVELVEAGIPAEIAHGKVAEYVVPLVQQGADVLVLGCTHYSFLGPLIQQIAGPGVTLIDPAPAVARHLRHRLEHGGLLAPSHATPSETAWTSGIPASLAQIAHDLCGVPLNVAGLPQPQS